MKSSINYKVSLGAESYPIFIGNKNLKYITRYIPNYKNYSKIILVTDKKILEKKSRLLKAELFNKLNYKLITLPSGEKVKSFNYLQVLIEKILKIGVDRNSLVICFGGGVLGDLVALAASLILRGIDFIQIPSTLLAQVDSSVGGKTAINSIYGKNLIGTFKQPKSVIISTDVLKTLDKREVISGYAEILKYSFIKDKSFFYWLVLNGKKIISLNPKSCIYAIQKSCSIKSKIVSKDEKEKDIREILNFGHTFGHAIESITGYSNKIKHGESIFIGMYLAIKFSIFLKLCNKNILDEYENHLKKIKIHYKLEDYNLKISPKVFIKHIKFDKKIKKDKIKFVLIQKIGKPVRIFLEDERLLTKFLKDELK